MKAKKLIKHNENNTIKYKDYTLDLNVMNIEKNSERKLKKMLNVTNEKYKNDTQSVKNKRFEAYEYENIEPKLKERLKRLFDIFINFTGKHDITKPEYYILNVVDYFEEGTSLFVIYETQRNEGDTWKYPPLYEDIHVKAESYLEDVMQIMKAFTNNNIICPEISMNMLDWNPNEHTTYSNLIFYSFENLYFVDDMLILDPKFAENWAPEIKGKNINVQKINAFACGIFLARLLFNEKDAINLGWRGEKMLFNKKDIINLDWWDEKGKFKNILKFDKQMEYQNSEMDVLLEPTLNDCNEFLQSSLNKDPEKRANFDELFTSKYPLYGIKFPIKNDFEELNKLIDGNFSISSNKNYILSKCLAESNQADIYFIKELKNNKIYALKMLKTTNEKLDFNKWCAKKEILANRLLSKDLDNFSHVVKLEDYFCYKKKYFLVYEKYDNSLLDLIAFEISYENKLSIAYQIALGLALLHDNTIIHRDIKLSNILVNKCTDGTYLVKIGDLTTCKGGFKPKEFANTRIYSPWYKAPEISKGKYTYSVDIYSLGELLIKLFTPEDFDSKENPNNSGNVALITVCPHNTPIAKLVLRCINKEASLRPNIHEVLFELKNIMLSNKI